MQARRIVLIASLLAAGFALSGCESFDPESWFNTKKPLPGERKAMFPGGVPGVPQGVPPELTKGYQPAPDIPPEVATQDAPKPRFVPRDRAPKPKQQAAAPDVPPEAGSQEAPAPRFVPPERKPAPKPKQAAASRTAPSSAPSQAQSQAQEQSAPPQAAPWPPQPSSQGSSPFPPPPGR
jgi:hypothetical protein